MPGITHTDKEVVVTGTVVEELVEVVLIVVEDVDVLEDTKELLVVEVVVGQTGQELIQVISPDMLH